MNIDQLIEITSKYDTPTMCNAMDVILGTRSATGFTKSLAFSKSCSGSSA